MTGMIDLKGNPFYLSDEDIRWVEEVRESLSVDEKLGQLFFPIGYSANEQYLQYELLSRAPGGVMFRTGFLRGRSGSGLQLCVCAGRGH